MMDEMLEAVRDPRRVARDSSGCSRGHQAANKVPGQDQAAPENGNGEPEADERVDDGHAERARRPVR